MRVNIVSVNKESFGHLGKFAFLAKKSSLAFVITFLAYNCVFFMAEDASSSQQTVQSLGKQLDIDFETISNKLIEMDMLVSEENRYQNYLSEFGAASLNLDAKTVALNSLLAEKDLSAIEIQSEILRIEKFKAIMKSLTDELIKIPLSAFPDPISLANLVSDSQSSLRPVIVDLKFSETFPVRTSDQTINGVDQQIFVTWQMTVKSRNLIKSIGVFAPPDFSGGWGDSQGKRILDIDYFRDTKPTLNQPFLLLVERHFQDDWIFETYIGRQWTYFDRNKDYLMAAAATGLESENLTCRIFINNGFTFDKWTPGCSEKEHFSIELPQFSSSQSAFDNTLSKKVDLVWSNRDKYRSYITKLNSYHKLEASNFALFESVLSSYQQLVMDIDSFQKRQLNKVAQLNASRLKILGEQARALASKKTTITCVKGKLTKKVTAVKPVCPAGYKKK